MLNVVRGKTKYEETLEPFWLLYLIEMRASIENGQILKRSCISKLIQLAKIYILCLWANLEKRDRKTCSFLSLIILSVPCKTKENWSPNVHFNRRRSFTKKRPPAGDIYDFRWCGTTLWLRNLVPDIPIVEV